MRINISTKTLTAIGSGALARRKLVSTAKELSPMQEAYRNFFLAKIQESGFDRHPFEGSDKDAADFFRKLSKEWKEQRAKLESGE